MRRDPVILVVEDDQEVLRAICDLLEHHRYECWRALYRDDALIRLGDSVRPPDLILLDFIMPGMTLKKFLSALKSHPDWARIPVVLMTAAALREVPLGLPMDAVVEKPFLIESLVATLRPLLTRVM